MKYLQPNMTNDQFIDKLKMSIEHNHPFSFSRFGDGEIYFINDNVPPKVIKSYLQGTYGYTDINEAKMDVLCILNKALSETDVIGLMDKRNPISRRVSYSKKSWSIHSEYVRGLRDGRGILVADHMITRGRTLGDINSFKHIIQGRGVAILSPHAELLKQNGVHKLLGVDISFIETPMGMSLIDRGSLFLRFDKIREPIVLYGCSLMGKDFAVHLKERGKIALDFGATLDAWAGLLTKRWFQKGGAQSHCLIESPNEL